MTAPAITRRKIWGGLDLAGLVDNRFLQRFWSKVDKSGDCWEWTAHRKAAGYGQFVLFKGRFVSAHTVSYALANGPIPAGKVICHHCDNPPCVKPDHLFIGTQSDNAFDSIAKGRANRARGEAQGSARLTEEAVREIRAAKQAFGVQQALATQFGVSAHTIADIRARRKWRHVQ